VNISHGLQIRPSLLSNGKGCRPELGGWAIYITHNIREQIVYPIWLVSKLYIPGYINKINVRYIKFINVYIYI